MKYTGFEMRRIIDNCKTPAEVQRVGNTVWEDSESFLPKHELSWFSYCLTKKVTELKINGNL